MNYNLNIACIGFGEVGSTCANLLNVKFKGVLFNIIDANEKISGRILDFSHACAVQENEVLFNDFESLAYSDLIIYSAGINNLKGQSRYSVAAENKKIIEQIFKPLTLKPTTLIVVVTNPVELTTRWIYEALNYSNLVVGTGTSLDTYRLNYLLARNENIPISEVKSLVLGEHGQYMTPIEAHTFIRNKSVIDFYSEKEKFKLYSELKGVATKIRETEKATKYGVACCVEKIVSSFLGSTCVTLPLSVLINQNYKDLLGISSNIFLSLPCVLKNSEIQIENTLVVNEHELLALKQAALHLENEYTNLTI